MYVLWRSRSATKWHSLMHNIAFRPHLLVDILHWLLERMYLPIELICRCAWADKRMNKMCPSSACKTDIHNSDIHCLHQRIYLYILIVTSINNIHYLGRKSVNCIPPIHIQYIPRNMHTVFALLCFVVVIHWLIFPYPPDLLRWHCGNLAIAPVPAKQPWWIWITTSCEIIMNDYITTTKQSTTKPCAYFLGYIVSLSYLVESGVSNY